MVVTLKYNEYSKNSCFIINLKQYSFDRGQGIQNGLLEIILLIFLESGYLSKEPVDSNRINYCKRFTFLLLYCNSLQEKYLEFAEYCEDIFLIR